MPFTQIIGTQGNDTKTTSATQSDIVLLLGGDDVVNCDFKTADYIVGGDGEDLLVTGGAFQDFSIQSHPTLKDFFLVRSAVTSKVNLVKGIESFRFTEGDSSLDDFIKGISPAPQTFDKTVTIQQFDQSSGYHAEDGVSEQFLIDLQKWQMDLTIEGFNASEDQLVVVSSAYSSAQQFVDANIAGLSGTWGWANGTAYLSNPDLSSIALTSTSNVVLNTTLFAAESAGWLKFGQFELPPEEKLQIDMSHFVDSVYNATDASEVITISMSEWNRTLTINNFDADHDKLVIASNGQYTSAQSFINANPTGTAGTWGFSGDTALLFNPNFQQISLVGISNAEDQPSLTQAETQGWIQFI